MLFRSFREMNPEAGGGDFDLVELIGFGTLEALRVARPESDLDAGIQLDNHAIPLALIVRLRQPASSAAKG